MPRVPIEYRDASPGVRVVFDDIKRTRQVDDVNNFWKYLAHDPALLTRSWQSIKEVMAPGALDALTKEMIYLAVSVSNGCAYCIASHTAAARKAGTRSASARSFIENGKPLLGSRLTALPSRSVSGAPVAVKVSRHE